MVNIQDVETMACQNNLTLEDSRSDNNETVGNAPTSSSNSPGVVGTFDEKLKYLYDNHGLVSYDMRVFVKTKGTSMGIAFHKILFVTSSPYFMELYNLSNNQSIGSCSSVKTDIEVDIFRIIKTFLYTNCFLSKASDRPLTIDIALKVLESSIQYGIETLTPRIYDEVVRLMTTNDVLEVLELARRLELKELESLALNLICINAEEVLQDDDFPDLGLHDVENILTSDSLNCNERVVFDAAVRWALKKTLNSRDKKTAFKYYFREVVRFIRFPLMTPMELAEVSLSNNKAMDVIGREELLRLFLRVNLPACKAVLIRTKFNWTPRKYVDIQIHKEEGTQTETEAVTETESMDMSSMPPPLFPVTPSRKPALKRTYADSEVSFTTTISTPNSTMRPTKSVRMAVDDDDDDLFFRMCSVTDKILPAYEDIIRKYYRDDNKQELAGFSFNCTITDIYQPLNVKNCKETIIDCLLSVLENAKGDRSKKLLQLVNNLDPMRYFVFNNKAPEPLAVGNLWSLDQEILLRLSGITFLKMDHKNNELVLNYLRESRKLVSNEKMKLKKLAVSNCEFSLKLLKDKGNLEKLILCRVWGEFNVDEIINECPKLSTLVCWKFVPPFWSKGSLVSNPLCLTISLSLRTSLSKLVLYRTELKFPRAPRFKSNISELYLDHCHIQYNEHTESISQGFCNVFSSLKKLFIYESETNTENGNIATSELINSVTKNISSIEWIRVIGLKWSSYCDSGDSQNQGYNEIEYKKFSNLLKNSGLPDNSTNFLLEKKEDWQGTSHDEDQNESVDVDGGYWSSLDETEYNWYEHGHFYKNYETFQDYFVQESASVQRKKRHSDQDDCFPRPILWY